METNNNKFLPVSVIAAGLLIAGAVMWNGSHPAPAGQAGNQPGAPAPTAKADIKNVKLDGLPFIGKADAPVTIANWSDFQCPFCKRFEIETLPQIVKDYVNTGKVRIVFLDFAFLGNDSLIAGEWSRAMWKLYPDKYEAWRDAMYAGQPTENSLNETDYLAWIKKTTGTIAGVDVAKVAADAVANKTAYDAAMNVDKAEAQKVGVNATPSFVIGTQVIAGAYPYATFKTAIDALVK